MAEIASGSVVLVNGRDVSSFFKTISVEGSRDVKESTALSHASKRYVPSLSMRTVSGEGFWATHLGADTLGLDRVFTDLQNAGQMVFSLGQGGSVSGTGAILMYTFQSEFKIDDITPGELKMMQFAATASGASNNEWARGIWLFSPAAANTALTNGTSYDTTTGGTGWIAHIHVVAGDGEPSARVQIEHSADNAIWADLSNATYSANAAAQVKDIDDAVNRYVRVTVTPLATTCTVGVSFKLGYTG